MFNNGTQFTMPVVPATYSSGGSDNGSNGWGDGYSWIWILLIFAIFGWGNGFGGFGGGNGGTNGTTWVNGLATRADINEGFALNNLQSGITAIQQGICDSTYALNNTITNGFHNQTIATMQGFNGVTMGQNAIQQQIANCCCETGRAIERGFADTNYNLASQTCDIKTQLASSTRDIVDNANANTRQILDFLTNSRISELQTELAQAQGQLSQAQQTTNIVNALRPCPIPAYNVPNPFAYCGCNPCGC